MFCVYATDKTNSVPLYDQWQNLTIKEKAQIVEKFKNNPEEMKKVDMLIALSPPMTNDEKLQLKNEEDEIVNKSESKNDFIDNNPLTLEAVKQAQEINKSNTNTQVNPHPQKNIITILKEYEEKHSNENKKVDISQSNESDSSLNKSDNQNSKTTLYDDRNFPAGKYLTFDDLKNLESLKEKTGTYYFTRQLKVDTPFNNSYICYNNQEESFWDEIFGSSSKDIQFSVHFPYNTDYLKNGSILFFSQSSPLTIKSIDTFNNAIGETITKINCIYYGKVVHAIIDK